MKDGDYPLTDKSTPWYQTVVEKRLDRLIWSQFPYTEENCKEIEELLEKLQTFMDFYKARLEAAITLYGIDWGYSAWANRRITSCKASLEYYQRNYEDRKGLTKIENAV